MHTLLFRSLTSPPGDSSWDKGTSIPQIPTVDIAWPQIRGQSLLNDRKNEWQSLLSFLEFHHIRKYAFLQQEICSFSTKKYFGFAEIYGVNFEIPWWSLVSQVWSWWEMWSLVAQADGSVHHPLAPGSCSLCTLFFKAQVWPFVPLTETPPENYDFLNTCLLG